MSGFTHLGKQVLANGVHYADAADPTAAAFIAEACAAKAGGGWQPIDTAPRDGTDFIGIGNNFGDPDQGTHVMLVHWDEHFDAFIESGEMFAGADYLTHWFALPAPPEPNPQAEAVA